MPLYHSDEAYPHDYGDLPSQKDYIEERDWDWLLVFDACRWDALDTVLGRPVEPVDTPGHFSTPDWISSVWYQDGWEDVTFVSGNPMTTALTNFDGYPDETLHEYVGEYVEAFDTHWDNIDKTCRPDDLTKLATQYDPPVVVHYVQPHTPFIGDLSLNLSSRAERLAEEWNLDFEEDTGGSDFYQFVENGYIAPELVRAAYMANLELVLRESSNFWKQPEKFGKVVITADHGEKLGPDHWSHGGPDRNESRVVPWVEFTNGQHPQEAPEKSKSETADSDSGTIDEDEIPF